MYNANEILFRNIIYKFKYGARHLIVTDQSESDPHL